MKRYHVTTFGCQMNAHDSERIKGMLESLGLGEATSAGGGGRARLQHVHDPREARHRARGPPRQRRRAQAREPGRRDRRRRLLRRGPARAHLRAVPVRRRRVRARLDPASRRLDRRRRCAASRAVASARTSTSRATCRLTASEPSRRGCRSRWAATRSARTASCRPCAAASRAGGRARSWPRSTRLARDGVREITLLGQNVNSWGRDLAPDAEDRVRRAAACVRRGRGHRADPLHEPASEGLPDTGDRGDGRVRRGVRARPSAAPVGLDARPQGDAPHVRAERYLAPRRAICAPRSRTWRSAPT